MTNPTSSFGWQMPTNTDLVTDLPADFEVFGQAVDTSMADLLGGTTGQILSKTSATNMDFTWINNDQGDITGVTAGTGITVTSPTGPVPTVSIDTATTVDKTTSQTLTNKTLTSPVLTTPSISNINAKGDVLVGTADNTLGIITAGSNGETLIADSGTSTGLRYNPPIANNINSVIGGGMDIWQRGTSFSIAASSGNTYYADRWSTKTSANQAITVSRQATSDTTNLPTIQYCTRYQRNSGQTGVSGLEIFNSFETSMSLPYSGKTVTVSFWARAGATYLSSGGSLSFYLIAGTGTDQNRATGSYTGETYPISNQAAVLTATWQRFAFTGTIGATVTELCTYFNFTPVGTAGATDYFEYTGVQIDIGTFTSSTAPAFRRSGGTLQGELAACQRYYYRQVSAGASDNYYMFGTGWSDSTTNAWLNAQFPVTMRIAPSFAASAANLFSVYNGAGRTVTAVGLGRSGVSSASIALTTSSVVLGQGCTIESNNNKTSYLEFSAEL